MIKQLAIRSNNLKKNILKLNQNAELKGIIKSLNKLYIENFATKQTVQGNLQRNPNLGIHSSVRNNQNQQQEQWQNNLIGDKSLKGFRKPEWFTGSTPDKAPGFNQKLQVLQSLEFYNSEKLNRQQMLDYFTNTWTLTELLFSGLNGEESFYRPPYHNLRHPMVFYYVHAAVVYVNKFRCAGLMTNPINSHFENIFETGVDEMSWDDLSKNEMQWPSIKECTEYRRVVYNVIKDIILNAPELNKKISMDSKYWALVMGFEHERIHFETSSVLIRELPIEVVQRPKFWPQLFPLKQKVSAPQEGLDYPALEFKKVKGQLVNLGKDSKVASFGWDNEYGQRQFLVPDFDCSDSLVTNGKFLEFVKDKGYSREELWTKTGWSWKGFRNSKWPTFWLPDGPHGLHQYKLRNIFEFTDMQWDWPVCTNYHEAKAFSNWYKKQTNEKRQVRLTTELEHQLIRDESCFDDSLGIYKDHSQKYSGKNIAQEAGINGQLAFSSESSVKQLKANSKGFYDVFGNVWQWCEGYFCALPGFQPHPIYEDFSIPCFDGQHNLMMGGSFISTGNLLSIWARYHFRSHFFQHSGIRLVKSDSCLTSDLDCPQPWAGKGPWNSSDFVYEKDEYLEQYLSFHFGQIDVNSVSQYANFPTEFLNFNQRIANVCNQLQFNKQKQNQSNQKTRALDLGCAVGAAAFEMTKAFDEVIGVDYSQNFVKCAIELQQKKEKYYRQKEEGEIYSQQVARIDRQYDTTKVQFMQGDACNLSETQFVDFDLVLMANLICRLKNPMDCLNRLFGNNALVKKGGYLVLTTPFSWLEEFTPKSNWIGGIIDSKNNKISSLEALKQILQNEYNLVQQDSFPFMIKEHSRKFQLVYPQLTIWQRKSN